MNSRILPHAFVAFLLSSAGLASASTAPTQFGLAEGGVNFLAIGRPSALKIRGRGSVPQGTVVVSGSAVSGTFVFDLESLDTGIKLRNEHMKKKYLEIEKFPKAELVLTKVELKQPLGAGDFSFSNVPFEGTLSLHGVKRPVSGKTKGERKGQQLQLAADFNLKVSDFGISSPSFAGVTMADEVQVTVEATAPLSARP